MTEIITTILANDILTNEKKARQKSHDNIHRMRFLLNRESGKPKKTHKRSNGFLFTRKPGLQAT